MPTTYHSFQPLVEQLLKTSSREEEVAVALEFSNFYECLLADHISVELYSNKQDTTVDGGVALSSQYALDCLKDPLRTMRFIKGTYQAILALMQKFPKEKVEVVYAGCGPVAPIIIPLLCLLSPDQLAVTLLDINETSKISVEKIINDLGAAAFFNDFYLGDAILYKHPENRSLHLVVSETMDKALTQEPQVRITQNLLPQLHEEGIFIPQSIDIYTEYSFYSKEPYFDIYKNVLDLGPEIKTADTQFLFSIDKDIQTVKPFEYTSLEIRVPANFTETPDISIYAEVIIFGDEKLIKAESLLSNPYCVNSLYNITKNQYRLKHTTEGIPTWTLLLS